VKKSRSINSEHRKTTYHVKGVVVISNMVWIVSTAFQISASSFPRPGQEVVRCLEMPEPPLVPKWPKVTLSQWLGSLGMVNVMGNTSISGNFL
jgi:hypothetical protein